MLATKAVAVVLVVIFIWSITVACDSNEAPEPRRRTSLPNTQFPVTAPTATPRPGLTWADVLEMQMAEYTHVRGASVKRDGNTISLVLVVEYAINETYARQLGDNFVRMTMALHNDGSPGKEIGAGRKYDYLVGVYCPNEKQRALGDRRGWPAR